MQKKLTKVEEQIMQVLWKLKQGFLKDILEQLPEPKPHSNTTATQLNFLIEKGFVNCEVQGRNKLYFPIISKTEYGKRSVNQIVKGYFEGSPAKLVSQFVQDNKLSMDELEAMMQLIKSAKTHTK